MKKLNKQEVPSKRIGSPTKVSIDENHEIIKPRHLGAETHFDDNATATVHMLDNNSLTVPKASCWQL